MKRNIIFYYPSNNIGGAQLLFLRLSEYLSNLSYDVYIIDNEDGYLYKNANDKIKLINIENLSNTELYGDNFVIVPLSMILTIKDKLKDLGKFKSIFWCIHPHNSLDILSFKRFFKSSWTFPILKLINIGKYLRIRKMLIELLNSKSLMFMDGENKKTTLEFYNIKNHAKDASYTPIPVNTDELLIGGKEIENNQINAAWIGRLSNDKIYSLLYFLKKINRFKQYTSNVHIIGDGEFSHLIKPSDYDNINIVFHHSVKNSDLKKTLIDNDISLVVGMGTSILESSTCHIPSLLIDPSYNRISDNYCPRWIFETNDFNLGEFSAHNKIFDKKVEEYFDELCQNYTFISKSCYNYVINNHSLHSIASKIEKYLEH